MATLWYQQCIHHINIQWANHHSPQNAMYPPMHATKQKNKKHTPFIKTPPKKSFAFAQSSYCIVIYILQASKQSSHTQNLEIRNSPLPFIPIQKTNHRMSYQNKYCNQRKSYKRNNLNTHIQCIFHLLQIILQLWKRGNITCIITLGNVRQATSSSFLPANKVPFL